MNTFATFFGFFFIIVTYNIKTGHGQCTFHTCYNCTVKCLGSNVVEQQNAMSKSSCIEMINNTTVKAVEYNTIGEKCSTSDTLCVTYNELYQSAISYTYRCSDGCPVYSLSGLRSYVFSDTPDISFLTTKDICIEHCIRTNRYVFDVLLYGPTCRAFASCEVDYSCSYSYVEDDVIALNRTCIQECEPPAPPTHGSVEFQSNVPLVYGEVAQYSCNSGYWLLGAPTSICGFSGTWSTFPPLCNPIVIGTSSSVSIDAALSSSISDWYSSVPGISTVQSSMSFLVPSSEIITSTPLATTTTTTKSSSSMSSFATTDISATSTIMPMSYSPTSSSSTTTTTTTTTTKATTKTTANNPTSDMTKSKAIYLSPCQCYNQTSFANMTGDEIVAELIEETTVDPKMTSLSKNKLLCMPDSRLSAKIIGSTGGVVLICCGLICLSCDIFTYAFKCEVRVKKKK